jgi:hypothetical protein
MRKKLQFKHFDALKNRKSMPLYLERETLSEGFFIMIDGPLIYECRLSKQRSPYQLYMEEKIDLPFEQTVKVKEK